MDDHAPHARPIALSDATARSVAAIWLRLAGLLAVLIPLFLGLQQLLEREETLAAEAARAAMPTPTAIVVEVPVTIERVVERTVFVNVPAQSETPPSVAPIAETAEEPPVPEQPSPVAAEEPPPAPSEPAPPVAEESAAPPAVGANLTVPARRPVTLPISAPIAGPGAEPAPEEDLGDEAAAESAEPPPEDAAGPESGAAIRVVQVLGPDGEAVTPAVAEPVDADGTSAPYASEPDPAEDAVEALAAAVDAVAEPVDGQGGDGHVDEGTMTPAFGVLELSEGP